MIALHSLGIEQLFTDLNSNPDGLTESEASNRLDHWSQNELEARKQTSAIRLFSKQFANFFILVLLFAARLAFAIRLIPGEADHRPTALLNSYAGALGLSRLPWIRL